MAQSDKRILQLPQLLANRGHILAQASESLADALDGWLEETLDDSDEVPNLLSNLKERLSCGRCWPDQILKRHNQRPDEIAGVLKTIHKGADQEDRHID